MGLYGKIVDLQKLNQSWNHVMKNKPAAGADEITCEDFDANKEVELKQLNIELVEHTYEVFPVKIVQMRKENKLREIALFTMRDKVVQASIANELNRVLEGTFCSCTYAYRENQSALVAISNIEEQIASGRYTAVLKTDVEHFFDNIDQQRLRDMLLHELKEEDTVELIMSELRAPSVNRDGELIQKKVGIYQGASISPVLSNLYLREVDKTLDCDKFFYARYADDIILLSESKENAVSTLESMSVMFADLNLTLNQDKTYIRSIGEGFDFLGYHFDLSGKSVPTKAEEKLSQSLEEVWLAMVGKSLEDRLLKGSQILNGWEQYYRGERKISNIYEYVTVVYMLRYKNELQDVAMLRQDYENTHKDIAKYLIRVWKENSMEQLIILEYEQLCGFYTGYHEIVDSHYRDEIIRLYEDISRLETEETLTSIMQAYSDIGCYDQAERISDRLTQLSKEIDNHTSLALQNHLEDRPFDFDKRTITLIDENFLGREDCYSREYLDKQNTRKSEFIAEPFTNNTIRSHLEGSMTIGTYLIRSNDTVHYAIIDIDVSKKALLSQDVTLDEMLQTAAGETRRIKGIIHEMGIKSYTEFSGHRGYHLWIFFSEWIPIRYVYVLLELIQNKAGQLQDNITLETYPMRNRKKAGHSAQYIKLPLGIHLTSGRRSVFLDEDFQVIRDVNELIAGLVKYSAENVKRVIGGHISEQTASHTIGAPTEIILDYERLGAQSDSVMDIIKGCTLMRYLINKAMVTGYLSHFERLSILNVFGHLGEDGTDFVHHVMEFTINYQYSITQMFIRRIHEKPVSCMKLRDQYKLVSAEYGCSCHFKRTKDCYPSPVIHALRDNGEENHEITIPISKTLSATKKEQVYEELNYANKVEELAGKITELNKQKRAVEKGIRKVEKELSIIYDQNKTDVMEIEAGLLCRKRLEDGSYDWYIDV